MNRLYLSVILFALAIGNLKAVSYRTEALKRMASYLPAEIISGTDSLYTNAKYPCVILKRIEEGEITHLGFQLFTYQSRKGMPVFADFLERIMLDIYQQGSSTQMGSRLRELKMIWRENGKESGNILNSFNKFLRIKNKNRNFSLNYEGTKYTAVWNLDRVQYELEFVASRELIYGTDMVEAEKIFYHELNQKNFYCCPVKLPTPI